MNDLDLFEAEIGKTYGDKDREMNAVMRRYQEFYQGHHDTEEGIWAYANRLWALWWEAGWDEQHFQKMLYEMAWMGMRPSLRSRIAPLVEGQFGRIDELFDRAVAAE